MLKQAIYERTKKEADDSTVEWLLQSKDPSVQYLTLTDILNMPKDYSEVEETPSCRTGEVSQPETFHSKVHRSTHSFTELHYPLYWHYDILQVLTILHRAGKLGDSRTQEAIDLVASKRVDDGRWRPKGYYWSL